MKLNIKSELRFGFEGEAPLFSVFENLNRSKGFPKAGISNLENFLEAAPKVRARSEDPNGDGDYVDSFSRQPSKMITASITILISNPVYQNLYINRVNQMWTNGKRLELTLITDYGGNQSTILTYSGLTPEGEYLFSRKDGVLKFQMQFLTGYKSRDEVAAYSIGDTLIVP